MISKPKSPERRMISRDSASSEHMVEFAFPGVPVYQLKVKDISETGIGVVVRSDSKFLDLIKTGQELDIKLLAPQEARKKQEFYKAKISHITTLENGKFKGHQLVALELISAKVARY